MIEKIDYIQYLKEYDFCGIETIRELIGNTSLKYTRRYVRAEGENTEKAINTITTLYPPLYPWAK
jgi:hypothetical protein